MPALPGSHPKAQPGSLKNQVVLNCVILVCYFPLLKQPLKIANSGELINDHF